MYTPIRAYSSAIALSASLIVLFHMGCENSPNIIDPPDNDNDQELHRLLVPEDYATIQAAIDSSAAGDTVLVYPGTYQETIKFDGEAIVVGSLFLITGDTSYITRTVIDADYQGSVATFHGPDGFTAELCGFTLTHGTGSFTSYNDLSGGGLFCISSSAYLHHLRIRDCQVVGSGGGIYFQRLRNPVIHHVEVVGCEAECGGGIYMEGGLAGSVPQISNALVSNCIAEYGGGIALASSKVIMDSVTITENTAWKGGGLYLTGQYPLSQSTRLFIERNHAKYDGGGVWGALNLNSGHISNNTAERNGGGIFSGSANLLNVTVANNQAGEHGGGLCYLRNYYSHGSTVSIHIDSSVFQGNQSQGGSGGGIFSHTGTEIIRTVFRNNTAAVDGGAIYGDRVMTIQNSMLVSNTAGLRGGAFGADEDEWSQAKWSLVNVTLASNQAPEAGAGVIGATTEFRNTISWDNGLSEFFLENSAIALVSYSAIMNGIEAFDYSSLHVYVDWREGNLTGNPQFVDIASGDYRLSPSSPCVDAGNPALEFNDHDGTRNDMGTYGGPQPLEWD
ncbi:right-handed parallel beta-helix repeat-containing protein [Candidatus Neomarinimicrobiota bacterium]